MDSKDLLERIDRLEDKQDVRLGTIENKLDKAIASMADVQSMSGQVKYIWTLLLLLGSGLVAAAWDVLKLK